MVLDLTIFRSDSFFYKTDRVEQESPNGLCIIKKAKKLNFNLKSIE